jgi:hypothetical protein
MYVHSRLSPIINAQDKKFLSFKTTKPAFGLQNRKQ